MKKNISILFVGNSHTFVNQVPAIVHDLFAKIGVEAHCVMNTSGGKCLEFLYSFPNTKYNIVHGKYDYVILQNKATNFAKEPYLEYGKKIVDEYISQTTSKTVLYMVWSNKGKKEEQEPMINAVTELAEYANAIIAPAGPAWHKALRCRPKPELYQADGNHATPTGSYLAASCIFYAISGKSRAISVNDGDEPHTRLGIDTKTAATLQRIACKTAAEYRK